MDRYEVIECRLGAATMTLLTDHESLGDAIYAASRLRRCSREDVIIMTPGGAVYEWFKISDAPNDGWWGKR